VDFRVTTSVKLSDGSYVKVPDGLPEDVLTNWSARANAALASGSELPPPPSGAPPSSGAPGTIDFSAPVQTTSPFDAAIKVAGQRASDYLSSANAAMGGAPNLAANVGADYLGRAWDAPASISNAVVHTAQKFGLDQGDSDIPTISGTIKRDAGITPIGPDHPWQQAVETAATIGLGGGSTGRGALADLISKAATGVKGEALNWLGSNIGGDVAGSINPKLQELGEMGGSIASQVLPTRWAGNKAGATVANPNAPDLYTQAEKVQTANTQPGQPAPPLPVTAGILGGPFVKKVESWLGMIPGTGQPIESARSNVESQVQQTRDQSAGAVAPGGNVDTSASAPGAALMDATRAYVNGKLATAKPQMDAIENAIQANTQGPTGGRALIDPNPLISQLDAMKYTPPDAAGNRQFAHDPGLTNDIDAEIANIRAAREPEDPQRDQQLTSQIGAAQTALSNAQTPQQAAGLQAQIQQLQAAQNANLKISFPRLRAMKTQQGYDLNPDGATRTINDRLGGQVYTAYGNAIADHVNSLDPTGQMGPAYLKAINDYSDAMDTQREFKKVTEGANEATLTGRLDRGLRGPEDVQSLATTPGFRQASANTLGVMGQTPQGFDPKGFGAAWAKVAPAAKPLYTQGAPDAAGNLDAAANLASNLNMRPQPGGLRHSLVGLALLEPMIDHLFGHGTSAATTAAALGVPLAASAALESSPVLRAMAQRSQPWSQKLQQNIPAIMAVAQAQGRNQGY
jgi:hypothetical protein